MGSFAFFSVILHQQGNAYKVMKQFSERDHHSIHHMLAIAFLSVNNMDMNQHLMHMSLILEVDKSFLYSEDASACIYDYICARGYAYH